MKPTGAIFLAMGMVFSPHLLHAQNTTLENLNTLTAQIQSNGQTQTDSVVQVVAESQGLQLVPPDALPRSGTFWLMMPNGVSAPLPCPPQNPSTPVFQISDGQFLVDDTAGQVFANANQANSQASPAAVTAAVETQATAVVNLINQVQQSELNREMAALLGEDESQNPQAFVAPTNIVYSGLALQITNVSNGLAYLNLLNATNWVYAIWSTTNLLTGWQVETEIWPTDTNCMPFSVPTAGRQNLFLRAEDWTDVSSHGDGLPDWWIWYYFGNLNETATNLDSEGNTLLSDFASGNNPNTLEFSIEVTNNYVTSMNVPVTLNVSAGVPSYVAVSVDDTNYATDASWTAYTSSYLNVNLGFTSGWHDVWIGLRGFADDPTTAAWQYKRLYLTYTAPLLVITNPTVSTFSVPLAQINGYSPQALASVTYDISNAVGVVTGQSGAITGKYYDPSTWAFTTNYFEAVDVPLAVGLNIISLHATDTAGNTTTTNLNLTLDYSSRTNPPAVQLNWPKNGEQISGSSFTWRGWVDDPMTTVSAKIIGADGSTNKIAGLVERNGNFWVENLPMPNGTNSLTLTVTDSAGNIATTNITVSTSPLTVTMTPIPDNQLWYKKVTATGSISDSTYSLWINGVKAGVTNGVWTAASVPMTDGGVASFKVTCYAPGETQPDGSTNNVSGN